MPDVLSLLGAQPAPPSTLAPNDFTEAASRLGCEVAAVRAVASVETGMRGPFDSEGRPTILFERHLFHRATGGAFDASHPGISDRTPGGYGAYSAQYPRLLLAASLNLDAALAATSWGAFQVLGENFAQSGYRNVQEFVVGMRSGVRAHLLSFAGLVLHRPAMLRAIRAKDWAGFAKAYNGPAEGRNRYDAKLAEAYERAA